MILPEKIETFPNAACDRQQAIKVLEEAAELFGTVDEGYPLRIWSEAADVVMAVCNLVAGTGLDDMTDIVNACVERNRQRGRYD